MVTQWPLGSQSGKWGKRKLANTLPCLQSCSKPALAYLWRPRPPQSLPLSQEEQIVLNFLPEKFPGMCPNIFRKSHIENSHQKWASSWMGVGWVDRNGGGRWEGCPFWVAVYLVPRELMCMLLIKCEPPCENFLWGDRRWGDGDTEPKAGKYLESRSQRRDAWVSITNLLCDPKQSHMASLSLNSSSIIKRISFLHLWRGCYKNERWWGTWLVQCIEHVTLALRVVS